MNNQRQPLTYSLFSLCISLVLAVVFCVVYSKQSADTSARNTERKLCRLVASLDHAYSAKPPASDTGREIANEIAGLHRSLRCSEVGQAVGK